jgi:RNA polymerase sigma-70 factor, ECF subfamily
MSSQVQRGTPNDFGKLLIASLPKLRRFAYSLCRRSAQADDLVQSACERALLAKTSWQPGTNFDAWMFRIIRNLWIDTIRRLKTAGPTTDVDEAYDLIGSDGNAETETRQMLSAVQQEILRLPDELREVLVLVCVEELSYKEAAEVMETPIGTVMSRLSRARLKLAEATGYGLD